MERKIGTTTHHLGSRVYGVHSLHHELRRIKREEEGGIPFGIVQRLVREKIRMTPKKCLE